MRAYAEQIEAVEAAGGRIILMASRALAAVARSADDYQRVYGELLRQCRGKVILHWLGEMFDPALAGYWGTQGHRDGDGDGARRSSPSMRRASKASRSRCSTRSGRCTCAAGCPRT